MRLVTRFTRFGLVGGSGVLVDMAVLYLLHDPRRLALPLVLSKVISAQVAIFNNFAWNELWTFGDRAARRGASDRVARFLRFELICLVGVAINLGVLTLCVTKFGMHYLVANAIAIGIATGWNFLVNLRFNWTYEHPAVAGRVAVSPSGRDASSVGAIERPAGGARRRPTGEGAGISSGEGARRPPVEGTQRPTVERQDP